MRDFLPYFRHLRLVKARFALGVLAGLFYAAASGAGLPLLIKAVFPILFNEPDSAGSDAVLWIQQKLLLVPQQHLLLFSCIWIPLIFAVRGAAGYLNAYLIQYCGQRVLEEIRVGLFNQLQALPLAFFKKNKSGDLLARMIQDTEALRNVITNTSNDLIRQPATLVFAFCFLVVEASRDRSFFVAMIALITVPLCVWVIRLAGKQLAARAKALQRHGGNLSASLTESLQAPLEIRAYNLQDRQINRFRTQIREILRLSMKVVKYRQAISPSIEVVSAFGFAFALFLGVREGMSLSGFISLGTALFMAYEPIKKLGVVHSMLKQGGASIERINHIMHAENTQIDPASPKPFQAPQIGIRFDHVSFAYNQDRVLHEICVSIPVGQVVALVGPSGAGKSTFSALIPRFYDPTDGAIRFDEIDIREFRKKDLRDSIAIVPQMPALLTGTIADNIRIGRLDASDEEVREAARKANAEAFILQQPDGYHTAVGERGDSLSGGQRQRIAIARAFLKNAPILILDEATSALDSESEAMVQQALTALVKGRTTFIIAHRFSTITIADRVIVFENGRIAADGSHDELRQTSPIYQSMLGSLPV
ncbi:MAG: ABC transporter ATP-binding protein [Luteolibacter sp.]